MKEMYKGLAFSPLTLLKKPINAVDTSIEVEDSSVLPPAPNYATINDSETIKYSTIAGNILSGCLRGVEGDAIGHDAGEPIARLFTAEDYNTMVENIDGISGILQPIEDAVAWLMNRFSTTIDGVDFLIEFDSLDKVFTDGIWNEDLKSIAC